MEARSLIAGYEGQTEVRVREKMGEARGGVLFIDEAPQLGESHYGKQALKTLLPMLTLPDHRDGKTVVVLAGYESDMRALLTLDQGLARRFPGHVLFPDITAAYCVEIVRGFLKEQDFRLDDAVYVEPLLEATFATLRLRPGWGNAGDAISLAKDLIAARDRRVSGTKTQMLVTKADVQSVCSVHLQRQPRDSAPSPPALDVRGRLAEQAFPKVEQQTQQQQQQQQQQIRQHKHEHKSQDKKQRGEKMGNPVQTQDASNPKEEVDVKEAEKELLKPVDVDVPDDDHKDGAEEENERRRKMLERLRKLAEEQAEAKRKKEELEKKLREEREEEERKRIAEELERQRVIEEQKQKQIAELKRKEELRQAIIRRLQEVGECEAGYRWKRNGSMFTCSAGGHFASAEQLGFSEQNFIDAGL